MKFCFRPHKHLTKFLLFFIATGICNNTYGQLGIVASNVVPRGDMGRLFNKANTVGLYYGQNEAYDAIKIRVGFLYTNLSVRKDTVPVYQVNSSNSNPLIVPGYLAEYRFYMLYFYTDVSLRLWRYNNFSLYAGIGLDAGTSHNEFNSGYEHVSNDTVSNNYNIAGLRINSSIEYRVNAQLDIFAESTFNSLSTTDKSNKLSHYTFGIGLGYHIKKRDE